MQQKHGLFSEMVLWFIPNGLKHVTGSNRVGDVHEVFPTLAIFNCFSMATTWTCQCESVWVPEAPITALLCESVTPFLSRQGKLITRSSCLMGTLRDSKSQAHTSVGANIVRGPACRFTHIHTGRGQYVHTHTHAHTYRCFSCRRVDATFEKLK